MGLERQEPGQLGTISQHHPHPNTLPSAHTSIFLTWITSASLKISGFRQQYHNLGFIPKTEILNFSKPTSTRRLHKHSSFHFQHISH